MLTLLHPTIRALAIGMALTMAPAFAQSAANQASPPSAAVSTAPSSEGEVRKVDKGTGKITIKHGELPNLAMPPMTMVFRAQDPSMLDRVKAGDKVRFNVEKVDGAYTVTALEVVK